jgi:putative membrane protein
MKLKRMAGALLLLLLASTLCAYGDEARLTDAQIAGIVIVANQAEIAAGETALRRTQSRSVQSFANRMVDEHAQVNREMATLMQRLAATPQRSAVSDALTVQSRDDLERLDAVDARDFDTTYLDREVVFLQQLLKSVDTFIRTTTSADLRTLLVRSRPSFIFHLDQAHRLQLALERPGYGH